MPKKIGTQINSFSFCFPKNKNTSKNISPRRLLTEQALNEVKKGEHFSFFSG